MIEAAFGITFNQDKTEVLLIKRRDVAIWVLPGGGIEANESPDLAAAREVEEETGVKVEVLRLVAKHTPINRLTRTSYIYECRPISGIPALSDETCEVGYFPLNKLPTPLFFLHKIWMDEALMNLPNVIETPISQVTYTKLLIYFLKHPIQVVRALMARIGLPLNNHSR